MGTDLEVVFGTPHPERNFHVAGAPLPWYTLSQNTNGWAPKKHFLAFVGVPRLGFYIKGRIITYLEKVIKATHVAVISGGDYFEKGD